MNFLHPSSLPSLCPQRRAFTLVELLSVISVMVLMFSLIVPSLTGLRGAGDLNKTAFDISGILESARAQAMAKNSYVWVGFASSQENTVISLKTSSDGTKPTTLNSANNSGSLLTLGKLETFPNVQVSNNIASYGGRATTVKQLADSGNTDTFQTKVGSTIYTFNKIIEINPAGEVRIVSDTTLPRWIEIGLQPMRGSVKDNSGNSAVLQIAGLTGQSRVFRP